MKSLWTLLLTFAVLTGCTSSGKKEAVAPPPLPTTLKDAVESAYRDPENRKRDQYRHPEETLAFFGLRPDMTVVEITPGAGWYLEILAPYLTTSGKYVAALPPDANSEYMAKLNAKVRDWLDKYPHIREKVTLAVFDPANDVDIVPPGTADMVLTFRNVHNWMARGYAQQAFNSFYKALKPGGILGVVEHRANPKGKQDPQAKSGYVQEQYVIQLAEKAGFKLDAKSEINANPKDTKNYPEGVWTLPPVLRLKDKERARYLEIGESDRMTLRFVKPAQ